MLTPYPGDIIRFIYEILKRSFNKYLFNNGIYKEHMRLNISFMGYSGAEVVRGCRTSRFAIRRVRSSQEITYPRFNELLSLDKFQHHNQDISRHITYGLTCLSGRLRNTTPLPCGNTREPTQKSIGYVAIDPIVGVETCFLHQENLPGLHQDRLPENNTHLVGICLAFGQRLRVLVLVWLLEWIFCRHCSSVKNFEGWESLPA